MPERVQFVHMKTGYDTDLGPSWISLVKFSKTWRTTYWKGRTLGRQNGSDGNFVDLASGEVFWISGPRRDKGDARYSNLEPQVDEDVREVYEAFLHGKPLPGREDG